MNAPFVFYWKLVWCDAFQCHYPTEILTSAESCVSLANLIIKVQEATAWCHGFTIGG